MNRSTKHEINNKLQVILAYTEKLEPKKKHVIKAAIWDIQSLVNETMPENVSRKIEEAVKSFSHYR